jgi:hypothetical protein
MLDLRWTARLELPEDLYMSRFVSIGLDTKKSWFDVVFGRETVLG